MKTDLSLYDNSWYRPGSKIKRLLWYAVSIFFFQGSWFAWSSFKVFLLKCFGSKIGQGVVIKPKVTIKYPWKLVVGNQCWIGEGVWIDNLDLVTLDNHVCISQGALLLCGNHNYKSRTFDLIIKPIHVESGAWIGAKSVIGPGVIVGNHAVLSLGSVASNNLDSFGIYRGNPAIKIKTRNIL